MVNRWHYPEEETPLSDESFLPVYPVVQLPQPVAVFLRLKNIEERMAYLNSRAAHKWCFLTAHDPHGGQLDEETNEDRTHQVVEHLRERGCEAVTHGDTSCPEWLPSGGILIIGIAEQEAWQLALDLGQNAILVGRFGETAKLLYRYSLEGNVH